MHPALSVIVFTTSSGLGYGLLVFLVLFGGLGLVPAEPWFGVVAFALSLSAITAGLLSSLLHLGHPERAWRALSQWRSSWLSREGVAACATYPPALLYALGWVAFGEAQGLWALLGAASALLALVTLGCTGMIYASLKTIRQWHHRLVVPGYLIFALASGGAWFTFLAAAFGLWHPAVGALAALALLLAAALKLAYWRSIDDGRSDSTPESATGLGRIGRVREIEASHTSVNFVMREMGFQVARKHARRLRVYALALAFLAPLLLILLALAVPLLAPVTTGLAALSATLGIAVERWLFFAEATHVVTLYYGAESA
jgi:DMSO reductase anchor subunit